MQPISSPDYVAVESLRELQMGVPVTLEYH